MKNQKFKQMNYKKLRCVAGNYEHLIFETIGEIENPRALQTKEHLRKVPSEGLEKIEKGFRWGGIDMNLWVVGEYTVPEEYAGKRLYAVSHASGREELFFVNGIPSGLFSWKNEALSAEHAARVFTLNAVAGEKFQLAFECLDRIVISGEACFDLTFKPYEPNEEADAAPGRTYDGVEIAIMNDDVKDLCFDLRELLQLALDVPEKSYIRQKACRVLDFVCENLVLCPQHYEKEVWMASVKKCLEVTRPFFQKKNDRIFGRVGIIGHSHLDTAWLWEVKETIRKSVRTYSNALQLMDQYPEYMFMMSSTLQAEWLKDYYPEVFEKMKQRIKEGRYELNGGCFIECDCNITGGEMMIRQFLKGQQFTRENFGYTMDTFWLPDTFGYSAAIPQIMHGCGTKYFSTNKLNANEINRVEHESFIWRGIDGSEVIAHIPVSGGHTDVRDVFYTGDGIRDKDATDKRLLTFGMGDGGGGPTYGMIEEAKRVTACEGMPETTMMTVSDFFKELEREDRDYLTMFDNELYFENHRGTLTTNHKVKRKTRKAESLFRNAEYFNVLSKGETDKDFEKCLKNLLLNQFHDILPGTCINTVYDTFNKEMDENAEYLTNEIQRFAKLITKAEENKISVFNTLSFDRSDAVIFDGDVSIKDHPCQTFEDVAGRKLTAVSDIKIPAFAATVLEKGESKKKDSPFRYDEKNGVVETPFALVKYDEDGYIASFIDKESGRELRKDGGAPLGAFLTAENCPMEWDNWNIDSDAFDRLAVAKGFVSRELVSDGAVELRLRSEFDLGKTIKIRQDTVFYADSPRVDFQTIVDWSAKHYILKAGFDLDLRSKEATCEIQYGNVKRPTHQSTSYDIAKFEVVNHKWTDISENRFGVALLNDCKYGVSFIDCNLTLTLMNGGCSPDDKADRGVHEMTYSLLPHMDSLRAENVIRPAYELNNPYVTAKGKTTACDSFITISSSNVICEAVKKAEDRSGDDVLRFYECEGAKTVDTAIVLPKGTKKAIICNMLEDEEREIEICDGKILYSFKPFEILTVKVK